MKFAEDGWKVYGIGRNTASITKISDRYNYKNIEIEMIEVDLSKPDAAGQAIASIASKTDRLDAVINAAGTSTKSAVTGTSDAEWEQIFRVNVTSAFGIIRESIPLLNRSEFPSIVNVSSIAGRLRSKGLSCAYTASKSALIGMTRHLALELADQRIRVNCVCPSQTRTPMLDLALDEKEQAVLARTIPLKRIAEPHEQANVIHFLCSRDSSYINGAIIDVNGGIL